MAAVTAAVTGAIGVGASIYGGMQQADAARRAGQSANAASQDWLNYTRDQSKKALDAYDKYVPAEQSAIDKSIQSQTANVERQRALVASIDPSLIEAGKQSFQLLQGQSAPVLQNLKDQRGLQRTQLLDTLRQQLGPGAETSSMGMNQLQKFDADTANMLSGAQQDYLTKVSGIALGGAQTLGQSLSQVNNELTSLGTKYGDIGRTQANIINGTTATGNASADSAVKNAGGAYAGESANGALWQNIGSGISKLGGLGAAYDKTTTPTNPNSLDNNISLDGSSKLTLPDMGANYAQPNFSLGANLGGSSAFPTSRAPVGTYATNPAGQSPQSSMYLGR